MAVPVVETTAVSNQTSNATSKSDVTSPASVVNNDIVLIFIAIDGDAANPEANADGFATLTSFPEGADEIYILWKRSSGSEPANYTVSWTGNEQARFMTVRVSGCITTGDPWDIISDGVSNSASTTNVVNRLTSTVIDTLALYAVAVDRDRVDGADTITGTGWSEVGTSGSSGGANGAGLIVGENDMPTVVQVEAGTFGTWASDQNASRGFNLKAPAAGPTNFERTASQTLTESDAVVREGSTFNRTGTTVLTHSSVNPSVQGHNRAPTQTLTHSESISRAESTFNRIGSTILVHSESILRQGSTFARTVAQALTHSESITSTLTLNRVASQILTHIDSVLREGSTFNRTAITILTHAESILRSGSTFVRIASQTLTHSESIAKLLILNRTASQTITHSEVISRAGSTFNRIGSTILTHSESISRAGSAFVRVVAQLLTHSELITSEASISEVVEPHVKGGLQFTEHKKWVYPLYSTAWTKVVVHVHVLDRKQSVAGILGSIYADPTFVNVVVHHDIKEQTQKQLNIFGKVAVQLSSKIDILSKLVHIKKTAILTLKEKLAISSIKKVSFVVPVEDRVRNKTRVLLNVSDKSTKNVNIMKIEEIIGAVENG